MKIVRDSRKTTIFLIAVCALVCSNFISVAFADNKPQTLGAIDVTGYFVDLTTTDYAVLDAGGGTHLRLNNSNFYIANNSDTTTNSQKDRNGCDDRSKHPIEFSTGSETLAVPLFSLPGEMGLSYSLRDKGVRFIYLRAIAVSARCPQPIPLDARTLDDSPRRAGEA